MQTIQNSAFGCCLIAAALTINTVTFLIDDVILNQSNKKICGGDISAITPKILTFFRAYILPIIKRFMVVEIFLCCYFAINCGKYTQFIKDHAWQVASLLLLPQIFIFLFCTILEFVLLVVFVYWFAFRNDRPFFISLLEFIYIFILWGIADLFFSPIFEQIIENSMEKIKDKLPPTIKDPTDSSEDITDKLRQQYSISKYTTPQTFSEVHKRKYTICDKDYNICATVDFYCSTKFSD